MTDIPKSLEFSEKSPFDKIITSFQASFAGLYSIMNKDNPLGLKNNGFKIRLDGKVFPILTYDIYSIHQKAIKNDIDWRYLLSSLCAMLMNIAYEEVEKNRDRSPLFEFFRHIRHASSHRNRFNFKDKEPRFPAEWRGKKIDHYKQGESNPLFGTVLFFEYLGPADPFLLLWDIDQHLIK